MKKSDHPHPSRRAKAPEKPPLPLGCVRTAKEVAEWFAKSVAGVDEWRNNGCPWTPGAYDIRAIALWVIARAKQRTGAADSTNGATQSTLINQQELRIKTAIAESREFNNRIRQGRFIQVDTAIRIVARMVVQASDLLQRIPATMAPMFPADVRDEIVEALRKEIARTLTVIKEQRLALPMSDKKEEPSE